MQNDNRIKLADEIKNKKYLDSYVDKWLKLDTLDKPYVECEICGYASNASIHQHLLVPEEFSPDPAGNRIIHLCANCHYELRAIMDRQRIGTAPEKIQQVCEDSFEMLKEKKKRYMEMNQSLGMVEV